MQRRPAFRPLPLGPGYPLPHSHPHAHTRFDHCFTPTQTYAHTLSVSTAHTHTQALSTSVGRVRTLTGSIHCFTPIRITYELYPLLHTRTHTGSHARTHRLYPLLHTHTHARARAHTHTHKRYPRLHSNTGHAHILSNASLAHPNAPKHKNVLGCGLLGCVLEARAQRHRGKDTQRQRETEN